MTYGGVWSGPLWLKVNSNGGMLNRVCTTLIVNLIDFVTNIDNLFLFYSHPGYFGKVGMRHFHLKRNKFVCPSVNVDKLWSLVSEQTRVNYQKNKDKAPVIDCLRAVSNTSSLPIRIFSSFQPKTNVPLTACCLSPLLQSQAEASEKVACDLGLGSGFRQALRFPLSLTTC